MENQTKKPITIVISDFKATLSEMINSSELPPFILEPIFKDMLSQIRIAEQKQLENDIKLYNEATKNSK